MRLALPIAGLVALLLSVRPASAQTINLLASVLNQPGPVTSCPATIKFIGKFQAFNWPANSNRQVQYKWIRSDGLDQETQTIPFAKGGAASSFQEVPVSWTLSTNGTNWEQLQVTYPAISNNTSKKATFTLTCPTPGKLAIPGP